MGAITALLILNFILTRRNNQVIEENRKLQMQAEQIKVTISQFAIRIIHNLDLGLRSYALFDHKRYLYPLNVAFNEKDSILSAVENALTSQSYPLEEFKLLKDSINAYATLNKKLLQLLDAHQRREFLILADQDKGSQCYNNLSNFKASTIVHFSVHFNGYCFVLTF